MSFPYVSILSQNNADKLNFIGQNSFVEKLEEEIKYETDAGVDSAFVKPFLDEGHWKVRSICFFSIIFDLAIADLGDSWHA